MCNVAVDPHLTAVEHHHHHSGASTTMHAITLSFFFVYHPKNVSAREIWFSRDKRLWTDGVAQMHVTTAVTRTPALIMVAVARESHQCAAVTLVGSADSADH
jgi:hypothetical protein